MELHHFLCAKSRKFPIRNRIPFFFRVASLCLTSKCKIPPKLEKKGTDFTNFMKHQPRTGSHYFFLLLSFVSLSFRTLPGFRCQSGKIIKRLFMVIQRPFGKVAKKDIREMNQQANPQVINFTCPSLFVALAAKLTHCPGSGQVSVR